MDRHFLLITILSILYPLFLYLGFRFFSKKSALSKTLFETHLSLSEKTFFSQFSLLSQKTIDSVQSLLSEKMTELDLRLKSSLTEFQQIQHTQFETLRANTEKHLLHINHQVTQKLTQSLEKTNSTFTDIMQRLTLIDSAQKKISDLSSELISLQSLLSDKRARGAFGEMQLSVLIENTLPSQCYSLQKTLSNGMRCDCILYLPAPTGNLVIDAKFPLEHFQQFMDTELSESDRKISKKQFTLDIKKHIDNISKKYILPPETSEGAMMFIPAEAVFSEIYAHHPQLVAYAQRARVWMVSPSTTMAILTTAHSVIKDSATRKQVHIIQEHLRYLAQDFSRFEKRMEDLSRHFKQAYSDIENVHTSAQKITRRFHKIDNVALEKEESV